MKKFFVLFFTALVMFTLTGCGETDTDIYRSFQGLYYYKDPRTGICYSMINKSTSNTVPISYVVVPCTPEVEKILVNK